MYQNSGVERALPCLDRVPHLFIHNTKRGHVDGNPGLGWIGPCLTFATIWIFDEPLTIPNHAPNVELVIQDAVPPFTVADQRQRAPPPASWSRDVLGIQRSRDRARTHSRGVIFENATYGLSFAFVDGAFPHRCHAIAVVGSFLASIPYGPERGCAG